MIEIKSAFEDTSNDGDAILETFEVRLRVFFLLEIASVNPSQTSPDVEASQYCDPFTPASSVTSATASLVQTVPITDHDHDPAASILVPDIRFCELEAPDNLDRTSSGCGSSNLSEIDEIDFKEEVHREALKNQSEIIKEKTDGLMKSSSDDTKSIMTEIKPNKSNNVEEVVAAAVIEEDDLEDIIREKEASEDDSDYDSDTSESEEEFMPDGERIRKTSRGFKQISNCKRFWRASMLMG